MMDKHMKEEEINPYDKKFMKKKKMMKEEEMQEMMRKAR